MSTSAREWDHLCPRAPPRAAPAKAHFCRQAHSKSTMLTLEYVDNQNSETQTSRQAQGNGITWALCVPAPCAVTIKAHLCQYKTNNLDSGASRQTNLSSSIFSIGAKECDHLGPLAPSPCCTRRSSLLSTGTYKTHVDKHTVQAQFRRQAHGNVITWAPWC